MIFPSRLIVYFSIWVGFACGAGVTQNLQHLLFEIFHITHINSIKMLLAVAVAAAAVGSRRSC